MGITIPVGANLTLRPSVEWVLRGSIPRSRAYKIPKYRKQLI